MLRKGKKSWAQICKASLVEVLLSHTVFIKSIVVIFLLKNCEELFHCKNYSHFFAKNGSAFTYNISFNILLTNNIISFEQLGPGNDFI